jgi:hypothetical protein
VVPSNSNTFIYPSHAALGSTVKVTSARAWKEGAKQATQTSNVLKVRFISISSRKMQFCLSKWIKKCHRACPGRGDTFILG